jgi:hypothetical protein
MKSELEKRGPREWTIRLVTLVANDKGPHHYNSDGTEKRLDWVRVVDGEAYEKLLAERDEIKKRIIDNPAYSSQMAQAIYAEIVESSDISKIEKEEK